MYFWRSLNDKQRKEGLEYRRVHKFPKHSPPHFDFSGSGNYLITAACYEHKPILGFTPERMTEGESGILAACEKFSDSIYAWCILPNHYHVFLKTDQIKRLRQELGLFHGRSAHKWNGEDSYRGRQVWHNCFERKIRSERHYFATLNYVPNNAVHHRYADRWQDWPWSNAQKYLEETGNDKAAEIWREFPVLDYGKKWDGY